MTHRECFARIMAGETAEWIPNYELGCWGQTTQRWLDEGLPQDLVYLQDMFEGEPHYRLDRRNFARLSPGMIPGFEHEVLEETERYLVSRHANGIVTKALKEGTVRGTRMSMDCYIDHPVKDRASWEDVKRRYDPTAPVRYPFWWDESARLWKDRDYPVCLLGNGAYGLYSQLRSWVGTEALSYLFYDDPALVEEMLEFHAEFLVRLVRHDGERSARRQAEHKDRVFARGIGLCREPQGGSAGGSYVDEGLVALPAQQACFTAGAYPEAHDA